MINTPVPFEGKALMSGQNACITIERSGKPGIWFSQNGEEIQALADNVISTNNFVVVGNQNVQVALIEHLMAAFAFCNIKNALVKLDGKELPIFDGSASKWVEALKNSDLVSQAPVEITEFDEPLFYEENLTSIVLLPSDKFRVTYMIDFDHKELKNRYVSFEFGEDNSEIINARTFGFVRDLEKFHQMGIALGAGLDNTVGLTDEGGYTCELNSEFEPVKHKILDMVGDLHLTGKNPLGFKAHIIAKKAGHKSHVEFAKLVRTSFK
ncbi:MAG: UDP-3-O-acyl-N-acetylglucosamine deacetylase [Candidatus Gastranaerophilales bacterium]|nr:UDP-3-O-acyl-N-acetylglucosamine deacetylase [Candidatus Gastranaerophilales bacterium]